MRFEHPHLLWLILLAVPVLAAFFAWARRRKTRALSQFVEARLLPNLLAGVSPARERMRGALLIGAVACLILACARPQWGYDWEDVRHRGLDIVVAVDTSKSMLAEDVAPNRLARAKLAVLDLMQQAKADRLGLVAFAGSAFLMCPLTLDDEAFRQSVNALNVDIIPQGGTAFAPAIQAALDAFKQDADNYKVLVLFTDGEDHDDEAVAATERAAKAGLRIFTIGVGSAKGEPLRVSGQQGFMKDANGNVVMSRLNEELLKEMATRASGFYLPLQGAKTIETLYEQGLAPLPKSESEGLRIKRYHERYHWPLASAMLLLIAERLLPERKRNKAGHVAAGPGSGAARQVGRTDSDVGAPSAAALVAFLVLWAGSTLASPSGALKDFNAGRFTNALTEYERLLTDQTRQQKPEDPRLHFNAGAAAYRATNYSAAIQHFNAVLTAEDIRLQQAAYYNLGNTHFRAGQEAEDLDKLQKAWEEAIKQFEHAVALDKADENAAFNLAFVQKGVEQIKLMRELARRAKEAADEATRRRDYHRALEIMEQILQSNIAARPFEEFTKKLKDIDAITNPENPENPGQP